MLISQTKPLRQLQIVLVTIASLAFLRSIFGIAPDSYYFQIYLVVLFTHYTLQYVYAKNKIVTLFKNPESYIGLICIGLTCIFFISNFANLSLFTPGIVFLFSIHHALTETYSTIDRHRYRYTPTFLIMRFSASMFAAIYLLRYIDLFRHINAKFLLYGYLFFVCAEHLLFFVLRSDALQKQHLPPLEYQKQLLFHDVAYIGIIAVLAQFNLTFADIVFYHVTFWFFYGLHASSVCEKKRYFGLHFISAIFYTTFLPALHLFTWATFDNWNTYAIIFGYIHILFSVAIGSDNPAFIARFFQLKLPRFAR